LAHAFFEPNLFPYKYPNILNPSYSSYLPAYEDGTDKCCEMLAYKIQTPGNYPTRKHITTIFMFKSKVMPFDFYLAGMF
jgi:hypothetical protein